MIDTISISIIVPAYNVQRYIEECVVSICGQMHCHHELIVVNDGSSDATPALLRQLQRRFHSINFTVYDQPNLGVAHARNQGVALARGDYIAFVDSDDVLRPGSLIAVDRDQRAGPQHVVAVDEGDIVAARQGHALVAGVRHAQVGLVVHGEIDAVEAPLQLPQQGRRGVAGAVVDDDEFVMAMHLPANRDHTFLDIALDVISRNDDADRDRVYHAAVRYTCTLKDDLAVASLARVEYSWQAGRKVYFRVFLCKSV